MSSVTGRIEGWEAILNAHIAAAYDLAFEWGSRDCALWCADWVFKATGEDLGEAWRGRYGSEDELNALLASRGMASAADIADRYLRSVPVSFAGRGDIVLHPGGALGICNGTGAYFLTTGGVTRIKTPGARRAWRV